MPDSIDAELKTRMAKYLDGLEGLVSQGAAQLPDVAREIVAYGFWRSLLLMVVSIVGFVALPILARKAWKAVGGMAEEDAFRLLISIAVPVLMVLLAITFVVSSEILLKTAFAPRIYILEYVGSLVK